MYTVYWSNQKEEKKHGTYPTQEEAFQSIEDWWEKNNYKPRYIRHWTIGDTMMIDYGLWHSFYKIVDETGKEEEE